MADFMLPDLSLRQSSITPLIPLCLTYYALGVLAILPNTFLFRLLLQPVVLWQAWRCVTNVDFSAWLAQSLGLQNSDGTKFWNSAFMTGMFCVMLRSFEWVFIIKEPIRKYELTVDGGASTVKKKPLSISSPLPQWTNAPPSIPSLFASLFPPAIISGPSGGSIFNPNLSLLPRISAAAFASVCGGVWTYSLLETLYHIAALIGRVVCRQPGSHWPPVSHRPWLSTSLHEFWSYRWHQLFRHYFITFGGRPGGALLGRSGALIGAFAVSAVLHHIVVWGTGYGSEFSTAGGFFVMMGVGAAMEGFFGWLWTMLWVLVWGIFMIDSDFFPTRFRPGKPFVDAVIGLVTVMANRWDVNLGKLNESALLSMIDFYLALLNLSVEFVDDNLACTEQKV
ncbi:hypothetical protein H4582DRAFT_1972488 [Lactarius indigo]|nr:hypothetical protein H4582DRAFT_1972488 [Lactarius indigo]